jgi:hypothetical protein
MEDEISMEKYNQQTNEDKEHCNHHRFIILTFE